MKKRLLYATLSALIVAFISLPVLAHDGDDHLVETNSPQSSQDFNPFVGVTSYYRPFEVMVRKVDEPKTTKYYEEFNHIKWWAGELRLVGLNAQGTHHIYRGLLSPIDKEIVLEDK